MLTTELPTLEPQLAECMQPLPESWWKGVLKTRVPCGDDGVIRARLIFSEGFIIGDGSAGAEDGLCHSYGLRIDGEFLGAQVTLRLWLHEQKFGTSPIEVDATLDATETELRGAWKMRCPKTCECGGESVREGIITLQRISVMAGLGA